MLGIEIIVLKDGHVLVCTGGALYCIAVPSRFANAMIFGFHQSGMSQAKQFIGLYTQYYQEEMNGSINLRQGGFLLVKHPNKLIPFLETVKNTTLSGRIAEKALCSEHA